MRVNWKVAAWNGVVFPEHREPTWSSQDEIIVKTWAEAILARFGEYVKRMSRDSELTRQQHRSAERSARFDGWAWVRLEVAWRNKRIENSVTLNNVNGLMGDTLTCAEDFAASLAHIIVAMRANMEREEARKLVWFDDTSPAFAEGIRRHKWVKEHPEDDGADYTRGGQE